MKQTKVVIVTIVTCLFLSSCRITGSEQDNYLGFNPNAFTVVEEEDTHGGFHGDGSCYLILDCSRNTEHAKKITQDWKQLPLTENLQLAMYGGEKNGVQYDYNFAEEAHWPIIRNGVYKFVDRHSEAVDKSDDTNLFSRYSFNFSIALYDLDTNILYYFEMDT